MVQTPVISLQSLLSPALIQVGLPGAGKASVINHTIDLLAGHPAVKDLERVRKAVLEREARMSTGIGHGVALPHAKVDAVEDTLVAFAVTAEPIDFEALDGEPVRLVFLLVSPAHSPGQHIRLLGRVSRVLSNVRVQHQLLNAQMPEDVLAAFGG